jgi:hypothetical protein
MLRSSRGNELWTALGSDDLWRQNLAFRFIVTYWNHNPSGGGGGRAVCGFRVFINASPTGV